MTYDEQFQRGIADGEKIKQETGNKKNVIIEEVVKSEIDTSIFFRGILTWFFATMSVFLSILGASIGYSIVIYWTMDKTYQNLFPSIMVTILLLFVILICGAGCYYCYKISCNIKKEFDKMYIVSATSCIVSFTALFFALLPLIRDSLNI